MSAEVYQRDLSPQGSFHRYAINNGEEGVHGMSDDGTEGTGNVARREHQGLLLKHGHIVLRNIRKPVQSLRHSFESDKTDGGDWNLTSPDESKTSI